MSQFKEWSTTSEPVELSATQVEILTRHFAATVTYAGPDLHHVKTTDVVGTVGAGKETVVVTPKMAVDRLLFMIAYSCDPYRWREQWASLKEIKDPAEGIAELFIRGYHHTLARGLLHGYRSVDADLRHVKGRIRFEQQARRVAPVPIAVRYNLHDDDIVENRLIKAAAARLRRSSIRSTSTRQQLTAATRALDHLTDLRQPLAAAQRLSWSRRNTHYRPLITLAQLILQSETVDLAAGAAPSPGFTLSLHQIFETFVRTVLREQSGWTNQEMPDTWKGGGLTLDVSGHVHLIPDLAVRHDGRWLWTGDAKYKTDSSSRGEEADLYQVHAYATATGLDEATLVYASGGRPSAGLTTTVHHVRHTGIQLRVCQLDLSQPPDYVLNQLAAVAATIPNGRGSAGAAVALQ